MKDLHIHTINSDGTDSVREIFNLAKTIGLSELAITDHDTIDGTLESIALGKEYDIITHTGIEFGVVFENKNFHLLGYDFDAKNIKLNELIKTLKKNRESRNKLMIDKVSVDYPIVTKEYILVTQNVNIIGKIHIINALQNAYPELRNSSVSSLIKMFEKNEKYYTPKVRPSAKEAIETIVLAGGVPVLAHPVLLNMSPILLIDFISKLTKLGLGGIEINYPMHNKETTKLLESIATKFCLIKSGGSDYHGTNKKNKLGSTTYIHI